MANGQQGIPISSGFTNSENDFVDKDYIQTVLANALGNTPAERRYHGKPIFVLEAANRGKYYMNETLDGWEQFGSASAAAGNTNQIQVNNTGAFSAFTTFVWDVVNSILGVGTAIPNPNAKIDIVSTTKGFLKPRMSTAQRIALGGLLSNVDSDKGMEVYDLDTLSGFKWNGTQWVEDGSGGGGGGTGTEERITFDSNLDTVRVIYYNGVLTFGTFNIDVIILDNLEFETSTDGTTWVSHGNISVSGTPPVALNNWIAANGSGNWYLRLSVTYEAGETLPTGTQFTFER